jgi:hypothetical protein
VSRETVVAIDDKAIGNGGRDRAELPSPCPRSAARPWGSPDPSATSPAEIGRRAPVGRAGTGSVDSTRPPVSVGDKFVNDLLGYRQARRRSRLFLTY